MAVNFARNNNIRLVIKNSGHDFNGKSVGGHSLSVWVHNLRGYVVYHPAYSSSSSNYSGQAVAYAGGFNTGDSAAVQARHNITILSAGAPAVGLAGGFFRRVATPTMQVTTAVVASGDFVTADAHQNPDLFWAFRGGGGGTFGIITSVVVKAFPMTPVTSGTITFSTLPALGSNISTETFWEAMNVHWRFVPEIVNAGGLGWNFIYHRKRGNLTGLEFMTQIRFPNKSAAEYRALVRPHLEELRALGIPVPLAASLKLKRSFIDTSHSHPQQNANPHIQRRAVGEPVGNTLIASRLFHKDNFASTAAVDEINDAIRAVVDADKGGYTFHGTNYAPSLAVSGNPSNAVNPALRTTMMHVQFYEEDAWWDTVSPQKSPAEQKRSHDRLQVHMDKYWKPITLGGGSYMNEGDCQDPDWKQAFYGSNYERLAEIKGKWDPTGLFWAVAGVGSDAWEMRGSSGGGRQGLITQDGQLCRVNRDEA